MTIIVGLVHKGVTYIGGDSLGSNGHSKIVRKDKKVFHLDNRDEVVIGYTTSFRMGQLLMYSSGLIDTRDIELDKIDHKYLVNKFIPSVIKLFNSGDWGKTNNGEKRGGCFLLGYKDKLYQVEGDFQVGESIDGFDACGCGEEFALGSLYTTKDLDDPIKRIHLALQAASKFSAGCSAPYYILNTKDDIVIEFKE